MKFRINRAEVVNHRFSPVCFLIGIHKFDDPAQSK